MNLKERMGYELMAARLMKPRTPDQLNDYIRAYYGRRIPSARVCNGHDTPFDYLVGSFFDTTEGWSRREKKRFSPHGDCVVWACRSGGKTELGAISVRLKATFNSGLGIRVLGGSGDQSKKMYDEIMYFDRRSFSDMVDGEPNTQRTRYKNGSHIEILMASSTSVRGPHVPVLMLDEIDEFSERIYLDALGIPQSSAGVRATVEKFSTAHYQGGLMERIIKEAGVSGVRVYRWCCWEITKHCKLRCTPEAPYKPCYDMMKYDQLNQPHRFSDVCGGKAKLSRGYYEIADLWQKFRDLTWERFACEYLCEMPKIEDAVCPGMNEEYHAIPDWPADQWRGSRWRLIMGADAGPTNSWVVWVLVGRLYPQDDFDTAIVVKDLRTGQRTDANDFADRLIVEHERAGFPKAEALFTGPGSVPQDTYMSMAMDKRERRGRLFKTSAQQPDGRRCVRVLKESMEFGWEAINSLLALRPNPEGRLRPGLMFCKSARATYDSVASSQRGKDEDHGMAALRYAIRGWAVKRGQFLGEGVDDGLVVASSGY